MATATLLAQTFSNQSGDWSSEVINAGAYTELILDAQFFSLSANATIVLNRIDPLGNAVEIWGAARTGSTTDMLAIDIGPVDGYAVSHAFGDQVQVVITTTGTYNGFVCLQGKG